MEVLPGLDTFIALANLGSVTAAARSLGVPRSTVSRRLTRLEQALGVRLVERNSRSVQLTEAGRALVVRGAPIVAELRALHNDLQQLDGEPVGRLKIAAPPGFAGDVAMRFVETLRERWPGLRPEFHVRAYPPHPLEDDFDVVLCEGPLDHAPWIRTRVGTADRVLVASAAYLEAHGVPTSVEMLTRHQCIGLAGPVDRAREWPLRTGGSVVIDPVLAFNDPQGVFAMVQAGLGVGLVPLHVCGEELAAGRVMQVLPEVGRPVPLLALTTRRRDESPKIRALLTLIDEFAREEPGASPVEPP